MFSPVQLILIAAAVAVLAGLITAGIRAVRASQQRHQALRAPQARPLDILDELLS